MEIKKDLPLAWVKIGKTIRPIKTVYELRSKTIDSILRLKEPTVEERTEADMHMNIRAKG